VLVAEDGSVELRLGGIFEDFDLFFGLGGKIRLEGIEIFLEAVNETDGLAVFAVGVFLVRHGLLPDSGKRARHGRRPLQVLGHLVVGRPWGLHL
jgi:hypothetical protein